MTGKQEEKELQRQIVLFEEKCKTGVGGGSIRFQDFIEQWFTEYAASHLKKKTLHVYRGMTRRVYAALGHIVWIGCGRSTSGSSSPSLQNRDRMR